jgi:hypothetical protein
MSARVLTADEVWELLGRIRVALHEFIPEHEMSDDVEELDQEADEIIKGIKVLGGARPVRIAGTEL